LKQTAWIRLKLKLRTIQNPWCTGRDHIASKPVRISHRALWNSALLTPYWGFHRECGHQTLPCKSFALLQGPCVNKAYFDLSHMLPHRAFLTG